MRKFASMIVLLSAFSLPAFAGDQGQGELDSDPQYICHAKDYENLWHQGYPSSDSYHAKASALNQCRRNSLAPETCRVMSCEVAD